MCKIYAHADPMLYESRSRSVRINGVITTIRLENQFWQTLSELAADSGVTTNQMIATLHDEVSAFLGEASNFSSFLRVTCLRYQAMQALVGRDTQAPAQAPQPAQAWRLQAGTCTPIAMAV